MKAVDSLDFETLSRREEGNSDDDDDNDDNECVDFNEEEVLQRCQGNVIFLNTVILDDVYPFIYDIHIFFHFTE
jgi:hypothetical protein